ncbi:hypothetical protein CsSME_00044492 [Camellia sinensis var. sinensis]
MEHEEDNLHNPVGKHGFSIVEFGRPDLFILCNIDGKSQLFIYADW